MPAEDQGLNGWWLLFLSDFNSKTEKNFWSGWEYHRDHRQHKTMADLSCAGNSLAVSGRLGKRTPRNISQLNIFHIQCVFTGFLLSWFFFSETLIKVQKISLTSSRVSIKDLLYCIISYYIILLIFQICGETKKGEFQRQSLV